MQVFDVIEEFIPNRSCPFYKKAYQVLTENCKNKTLLYRKGTHIIDKRLLVNDVYSYYFLTKNDNFEYFDTVVSLIIYNGKVLSATYNSYEISRELYLQTVEKFVVKTQENIPFKSSKETAGIQPFFGDTDVYIKLEKSTQLKFKHLIERLLHLGFKFSDLNLNAILKENFNTKVFYINLFKDFSCSISEDKDVDINLKLSFNDVEKALHDFPYLFVDSCTYFNKFKHKFPVAFISCGSIVPLKRVDSRELLTDDKILIVLKKEFKNQ